MNIPVHVAAAAVVCNATLYVNMRFQKSEPSKERLIMLGTLCFVVSLFSHLLLDVVPHYDFLYKILPLPMLPKIWGWAWATFKVGVVTFPVVILFLYLTRDHLIITLVSLLGSIYPDIEKALYLNLHIPKYLVIFRQHSCSYSPDGWESTHKLLLSAIEIVLLVILMVGFYWIARCRISSHNKRSSSLTLGLFFR